IYELVLRPLSAAEKDAYYAETTRFAALFGIPGTLLPPDWQAFEDYWRRMLESPAITVSPVARRLARSLLHPPGTWIGPAWDWLRAITARLLPPRLREEFGLPYGPVEQALAEGSLRTLRAGWWLLPGSVRWLPAYRDAVRRLEGRGGRDPIGIVLDGVARLARGWREQRLGPRAAPRAGQGPQGNPGVRNTTFPVGLHARSRKSDARSLERQSIASPLSHRTAAARLRCASSCCRGL